MKSFYIAIKGGVAEIVELKLSKGVKPSLPNYTFIGAYTTKKQAENNIPKGIKYKDKVK